MEYEWNINAISMEYWGSTWWLIPLSKWVITPVINGISRVNPLITGVITHLLSGMNHHLPCGNLTCSPFTSMMYLPKETSPEGTGLPRVNEDPGLGRKAGPSGVN